MKFHLANNVLWFATIMAVITADKGDNDNKKHYATNLRHQKNKKLTANEGREPLMKLNNGLEEDGGRRLDTNGNPDVLKNQMCMETVYDEGQDGILDGDKLQCTANDIQLARVGVREPVPTCHNFVDQDGNFVQDTVTFMAEWEIELTAQERFDIGLWISTDGDENGDGSYTGECTVFTLPTGGISEFSGKSYTDLDFDENGGLDTCGDIDNNHNPITVVLELNEVACRPAGCDSNDDACLQGPGKLGLPYCSSWRQKGANELCESPLDAFPGSPSKCFCGEFTVDIDVCTTGNPMLQIQEFCDDADNRNYFTVSTSNVAAGTICKYTVGDVEIVNDCGVSFDVGSSNRDVVLTPPGTFDVTVEVGQLPCVGTSSETITVNEQLVADGSLEEICANGFNYAESKTPTQGVTSGWTFDNSIGPTPGTGQYLFNPELSQAITVSGIYSASLSVCSISIQRSVPVYPPLDAGSINESESCDDDGVHSKTFSVNPSGGSGTPYTCEWSVGGISETQTPCGVFAPSLAAGDYIVSVTVTDGRSFPDCDATAQRSFTVNPDLVIVSASLSPICANGFDYTGTATGGNPVTVDANWTFTDASIGPFVGTNLGTNRYDFPVAVTSKTTVEGTYTAFDGVCTKAVTAMVDVYPALVAGTISASETCDGDGFHSKTFSINPSGGSDETKICTWSVDGVGDTMIISQDVTQDCSYVFAPSLDAGDYTVSVTVKDTGRSPPHITDCAVSASTDFTINPQLQVQGMLKEICADGFMYSGTATGGGPTMTAEWIFTDPDGNVIGSIEGPSFLDESFNFPVMSPTSVSGTYTASDGVCAVSTTALSVNVYPPVDAGDISVSGDCNGASQTKAFSVQNPSGGSGAYSCAWSYQPDDGVKSSETSQPCNELYEPTVIGMFTVFVTVKDTGRTQLFADCESDTSTDSNVHATLIVALTLTETCANSFDYDANVMGGSGSYTYMWKLDDGSIDPMNDDSGTFPLSPPVDEITTVAVILDVEDTDSGCTASANDSVDVYPVLSAFIYGDSDTCTAPGNLDMTSFMVSTAGGSGSPMIQYSSSTGNTDCSVANGVGTCDIGWVQTQPDCFTEDITVYIQDRPNFCDPKTLTATIGQTSTLTLTPTGGP